MKKTTKFNIFLGLFSILLVGCNNTDVTDENWSAISSDVPTSESTANSSTTTNSTTTNSTAETNPSIENTTKLTNDSWNLIFSKEAVSNLKVMGKEKVLPHNDTFNKITISDSNEIEFVFSSDGNKEHLEITSFDRTIELLDSDFDTFVEKNPGELFYAGSKEQLYNHYVQILSAKYLGASSRNSKDNGYIVTCSIDEPVNYYFERTENNDLVYDYVLGDANYTKTLLFIEDLKNYSYMPSFNINNLLNLYGLFEHATYNSENECYQISSSSLFKNEALSEDSLIDLYFYDGKLTKCVLDDNDKYYEYEFSNLDKKINLPTNLKACEHPSTFYANNEDYHYVRCNSCNNIMEYEKHSFCDGECGTCKYAPVDSENIYGSDGELHFTLYKNKLTNEYTNYSIFSLYQSTSGDNLNHTDCTCYSGNCNLKISYDVEKDVAVEGKPCTYNDIYHFTFYEGTEKIHDNVDVSIKSTKHNLEIVDWGTAPEKTYQGYANSNVTHGTVRCKDCGDIFEDIEIKVYSYSDYDYISLYKPGYSAFDNNIRTDHDINSETHKCIYCNKTEAEIGIRLPMPTLDIDFLEIDESSFRNTYESEFVILDFTLEIPSTFYIGNSTNGLIYYETVYFADDEWKTNIDNILPKDLLDCINMSSKTIIDKYVSENGVNGSLKFYYSSEIGLMTFNTLDSSYNFYFNADGFIIRYEQIDNNGLYTIQGIYSLDSIKKQRSIFWTFF